MSQTNSHQETQNIYKQQGCAFFNKFNELQNNNTVTLFVLFCLFLSPHPRPDGRHDSTENVKCDMSSLLVTSVRKEAYYKIMTQTKNTSFPLNS